MNGLEPLFQNETGRRKGILKAVDETHLRSTTKHYAVSQVMWSSSHTAFFWTQKPGISRSYCTNFDYNAMKVHNLQVNPNLECSTTLHYLDVN